MNCGKCGSAMDDGALFCPNCGEPAPIEAAEPSVQPAAEPVPECQEPADEVYMPLEDAEVQEDLNEAYPSMALNTEGEAPAPKKVSKLPFLIGGIAAVVAAVLLVVFNWSNVAGFFTRTFSSAEKLQSKVYEDTVSKAFDELESSKNETVDLSNVGYEGEIRLSLNEKLLNAIIPDMGMDFSWLSEIAIGYDVSVKDQMGKIDYDLILGETSIIGAQQVSNGETMEQWISIPEFNDQALYINAGEAMDMSVFGTQSMGAMTEIMPSQDEVEKIMLRYVKILMSGIKDVEKSSDTVTVSGISQKLHMLEASIDQDDIADIAKDLLKELKKDKDIEEIIRDMEEHTGEEDMYESFVESIEEELEYISSDDLDEVDYKLTITTYLNSSNDIVGLKVKVTEDGEKIQPFYWVTVESGKKFATKIVLTDEYDEGVVIEGEGEHKDTTDAEYVLSVNDEEMLTVKISDFVADNEKMSGTIRIVPSETVMESIMSEMGLGGSESGIASEMVEALEISISGTSKDGKVLISVVGGSTKYITLTVSVKQAEAEGITVPENYVDFSDYDAQDEWLSNINFEFIEVLMDRLTDAGVPEELFEALVSGAV